MPAQNVTVSADFEPDKANFSDTFKVTVDGSKTEIGTELTATVAAVATDSAPEVPSELTYQWYRADDAQGAGEAAIDTAESETYTLAADDLDKYVYVKVTYTGEEYVPDKEIVSEKIGPVTMKLVASYDFEDSANKFTDTSYDGNRTTLTVADDETTSSKVQKITCDNRNQRPTTLLDFSNEVKNAVAAKVEFDLKTDGSTSAYVTLGDIALRGRDAGGSTSSSSSQSYGNKGAIAAVENLTTSGGSTYKINGTSSDYFSQINNEWHHVSVSVDYAKRKVSYKVTKGDEVVVSADNVDYMDTDANYINCIDTFMYAKTSIYIDNVAVYANIGESDTVTINYQDAEGHTLKASTTDENAVKTLPYKAAASTHESFKATGVEGKDYWCVYDESSTDTIPAVGDDAKTINLKFTTTEYAVTPIKVTVPSEAESDVTVNMQVTGSATLSEADGADVNESLTLTIGTNQTEATDSTLKLLPGTYNYTIDPVAGYKLDSYEGTLTAGQENKIDFEINDKVAANVTVNYQYNGKTIASEQVALTGDGPYVNDEFTLPESYYTDVVKKVEAASDDNNDVADTFRIYTVDTEQFTGEHKITPAAADDVGNKFDIPMKFDNKNYYYYEDYNSIEDTTYETLQGHGWKTGDATRYTVTLNADTEDKYVQVATAIGTNGNNGGNGTAVENSKIAIGASINPVFEFDMALTPSDNQTSTVFLPTGTFEAAGAGNNYTNKNYMFGMFLSEAKSTTWKVFNKDEVTLESGTFYHYRIERTPEAVKVKITSKDGGSEILTETSYTTADDEHMLITGEITKLLYNTARYNAGMKFDNAAIYVNAE